LTYAFVAVVHANDSFHLDLVSGIMMGLSDDLNHGMLYPDIQSGERFGGVRYMPLQIFLHAGLAHLTGEYLLAGKLLTYILTFASCFLVVLLARRLGAPWPVGLLLAALVVTSHVGFFACTTIRTDLLSVVLQLGALLVAWGEPSARKAAGAALLCGLAVLAKLTAVWAGAASALVWLVRDWRRGLLFCGYSRLFVAAGLGLVYGLSNGRILDNFTGITAAGITGLGAILKAPLRLVLIMSRGGSVLN